MSAAKRLLNSTEKGVLMDFLRVFFFLPSLVWKHLSVVCSNAGLGHTVQGSAGSSWKVKYYWWTGKGIAAWSLFPLPPGYRSTSLCRKGSTPGVNLVDVFMGWCLLYYEQSEVDSVLRDRTKRLNIPKTCGKDIRLCIMCTLGDYYSNW